MQRDFSHPNTTPHTQRSARRKNTVLPDDPTQAIHAMMETIDALRDVYIEETKALEASDASGFLVLQDQKMQTARHYQKSIAEILARRDEVKAADPDLKQKLIDVYDTFKDELETNQNALKRMGASASRLKATITRATQDAVKKKTALNYGQSGALNSDPKRILSTGLIETA